MKSMTYSSKLVTYIEPKKGWVPLNIKELWKYRELLYFLTKRDIKIRYKQTVLGGLWAIIQPVFTMIVFTIFFGKLAKVPSDGVPYPIFVYAGLLPWTYFSNVLTISGNSLVVSAKLITKVYFPRLIVPAVGPIAGIIDFSIAMTVLICLMIYYQFTPSVTILLFPMLLFLTFLCALGTGLWLSALNVKYRDIRFTIPFLIQLWLFVTPVIYPVSMANEKYHWLFAINPMGGVIKTFRSSLLGHMPIDWNSLGISSAIIVILLVSGLYYFRRVEKHFSDVV
jgi:lipopolysaccharide transport system permease protein